MFVPLGEELKNTPGKGSDSFTVGVDERCGDPLAWGSHEQWPGPHCSLAPTGNWGRCPLPACRLCQLGGAGGGAQVFSPVPPVTGWPQPLLAASHSPTLLLVLVSQRSLCFPPAAALRWAPWPNLPAAPLMFPMSFELVLNTCPSPLLLHVEFLLSFCFHSPCSTDHLLALGPSSPHAPCAGGQRLWVP